MAIKEERLCGVDLKVDFHLYTHQWKHRKLAGQGKRENGAERQREREESPYGENTTAKEKMLSLSLSHTGALYCFYETTLDLRSTPESVN